MSDWKQLRNSIAKKEFTWEHKDVVIMFLNYMRKEFSCFDFFFLPDERDDYHRITYRAKLFPRDLYVLASIKNSDDKWSIMKGFSEFNNDIQWKEIQTKDDVVDLFASIDDSAYLKRQHEIYASLGKKDVFEGTIYVEELYLNNPNDVALIVQRTSVEKLAETKDYADIEFMATKAMRIYPQSSLLNEQRVGMYKIFEVSGMVVSIDLIANLSDDQVKISGKKISPTTPQSMY